MQQFEKDCISRHTSNFNDKLEKYIIENLRKIGFCFSGKDEFHSFVKERITRVSFEDVSEVQYYLDYVDENNKGELIGITNENKCEYKIEGNILTIST